LILKLQDFDNPDAQYFALDEISAPFAYFREEHDLIEPILEILKQSKEPDLKVEAIRALNKIHVTNEKVIPTLTSIFQTDRSIRVKSKIPFIFQFYQKESKELVEKFLVYPSGEVRLNTIKILGYFNEEKEFAIILLEDEIKKDQLFEQKLNCLFSLIRLEGLDSRRIKETDDFLKNSNISKKDLENSQLELKHLQKKLIREKQRIEYEQKVKEKWYKKKDFLKNSFEKLQTYDYNESGIDLQTRYADFIISILKGRIATLVSLESLKDFPGKNLPKDIKDIIESDYEEIEKTINNKNDSLFKQSDEYRKYSDFFTYMLWINNLSAFNLNYILLQNNSRKNTNFDLKLGDVFRKDIIEDSNEVDSSYEIYKEEYRNNSKIIEKITKVDIKDFSGENLQFQSYLLNQELCWHFAILEAFLHDSLEFLAKDLKKTEFKIDIPIHFSYKGKMSEFCMNDFERSNFPESLDYLIKLGFLDKSWLPNKENRKKISCFRSFRNAIIHYNGRLVSKHKDAYCIDKYPNDKEVSIDVTMVEDLIELIINLARAVYNSISEVTKKKK